MSYKSYKFEFWFFSRMCFFGDFFFTSRASVMMQPITAHTRNVASMSSFCNVDFSWSIGTSQAPMAGVAVLNKFSCLKPKNKLYCYLTFICAWLFISFSVLFSHFVVLLNPKMWVYLDITCIWERMLVGAAKLNQISFIVSFILLESGGGGSKGRSFFRSSDSTPSSYKDKYTLNNLIKTIRQVNYKKKNHVSTCSSESELLFGSEAGLWASLGRLSSDTSVLYPLPVWEPLEPLDLEAPPLTPDSAPPITPNAL